MKPVNLIPDLVLLIHLPKVVLNFNIKQMLMNFMIEIIQSIFSDSSGIKKLKNNN